MIHRLPGCYLLVHLVENIHPELAPSAEMQHSAPVGTRLLGAYPPPSVDDDDGLRAMLKNE